MATIWNFVTDFGDSAVTVPLALLTLGFLLAAGQRRLAIGWVLAIGGCAAAIGALKLICGACGWQLAYAHLLSPSGHTAMSTAIYGAFALLIASQLPEHGRRLVYLTASVAIVGIALSRVALYDHSPEEVVVGFAVGAVAVTVFHAMLARHAAPALPLGRLLLSGGALVVLLHGSRWMVEPTVHRLAWDFRLVLPWCRL